MDQPPLNAPAWYQTELVPGIPLWAVIVAGLSIAAFLAATIIVLRWLLRRPTTTVEPPPVALFIDLTQLRADGPTVGPMSVEIYGTPVRIAVLVLAPVGREGLPPTVEEFVQVMEQLVPGFGEAVYRDQPIVRIWPGQLSSQGFTNSFFNNVPLPGSRGKGTPWCCIAGKFTALDRQYLTGIVCCSTGNNALGQYIIQHEGQWNDVLRVRRNVS